MVINLNGRPTIVDSPLTLIFKMGQEAFHVLFAYIGSQFFVYDYMQPPAPQITDDI
jgi:hypothetical protein